MAAKNGQSPGNASDPPTIRVLTRYRRLRIFPHSIRNIKNTSFAHSQ